ncbi:hypothetical protein QUB60_10300 [Microcoleus sp. A2-C5]
MKEEGRRKREEVNPPLPPPRGEIQEEGRRGFSNSEGFKRWVWLL